VLAKLVENYPYIDTTDFTLVIVFNSRFITTQIRGGFAELFDRSVESWPCHG